MTTESTAENTTRAWVDIDLGALVRNGAALARHARVPILPMVKADAYGLGVGPVTAALETLDPFGFGVATVVEGCELRSRGVKRPVIVFTPILPEEFPDVRGARLTPTLSNAGAISAWTESGGGPWHLAIDTGMNRAGARWDAVASLAAVIRRSPPEGAYTHFHSAELDDGSMEMQERRFRDALAALPMRPAVVHTDNSAAITRRSPSLWNAVRPGVFLYGVGSGPGAAVTPEAVVSLSARVVELRDVLPGESVSYDASWTAARHTRVATLPIGYADGYRRSLGNRGNALVNGVRARVVGTVTMDMTMIDVTGVACRVGDTATLIGTDGPETISVDEVGTACGLSPYEILTGLRQRAGRRYR
ncbi:MAG TPA: alanine racemase [Gemmatimonadaceae bacterium]|nr:alanine racemase [Gemmatimonadaceae bacterium]